MYDNDDDDAHGQWIMRLIIILSFYHCFNIVVTSDILILILPTRVIKQSGEIPQTIFKQD